MRTGILVIAGSFVVAACVLAFVGWFMSGDWAYIFDLMGQSYHSVKH